MKYLLLIVTICLVAIYTQAQNTYTDQVATLTRNIQFEGGITDTNFTTAFLINIVYNTKNRVVDSLYISCCKDLPCPGYLPGTYAKTVIAAQQMSNTWAQFSKGVNLPKVRFVIPVLVQHATKRAYSDKAILQLWETEFHYLYKTDTWHPPENLLLEPTWLYVRTSKH